MSNISDYTKEVAWLLKEKHGGIPSEEFDIDVERLKAGEPLGYVIGFVPFLDTKIYLDLPAGQEGSRPLIPRPETEYWVEKAIDAMSRRDLDIGSTKTLKSRSPESDRGSGKMLRILDLCAGSGCIGIAVAHHVREVRVDFAEIDPHHHPTILKNLLQNNIAPNRTRIFGGNLFEKVDGPYDFILANPPYINPDLTGRIDESVLAHEPHLALFGGLGGMDLISKIIKESPRYLSKNGVLYIEHEPEQQEAVAKLAETSGFVSSHILLDQYRAPRTTRLARDS